MKRKIVIRKVKYIVWGLVVLSLVFYIVITYKSFLYFLRDSYTNAKSKELSQKEVGIGVFGSFMDSFSIIDEYLHAQKEMVYSGTLDGISKLAWIEYANGNYSIAKELTERYLKKFKKYVKGKKYINYKFKFTILMNSYVNYRLSSEEIKNIFTDLYLRLADCCFRLKDVRNGKKYLNKTIENLRPDFLLKGFNSGFDYIKCLFVMYIYKREIGLKPYSGYYMFYNLGKFSIRQRIYLIKEKEKFENRLMKSCPLKFKSNLNKFFNPKSPELLKIINNESKKPYCDVDVEKYFKPFESEVLKRVKKGEDLRKYYGFLYALPWKRKDEKK